MHEKVASLGTADGTAARGDASGRGNTKRIAADPTGSAAEGGEVGVQAGCGKTTSWGYHGYVASINHRILQPSKQLAAACAVKEGINTRSNSSHGKFMK